LDKLWSWFYNKLCQASEVLGDSCEHELVLGIARTPKTEAPSRRMRFKCANLISMRLRSWRDGSKAAVPATDRPTREKEEVVKWAAA
jgi:hypothetical protein